MNEASSIRWWRARSRRATNHTHVNTTPNAAQGALTAPISTTMMERWAWHSTQATPMTIAWNESRIGPTHGYQASCCLRLGLQMARAVDHHSVEQHISSI